MRLAVGDPAPAFALPDTAGRIVRRSDFAGRRLVLYFYPADLTPGCTTEACQFNDELTALRDLGADVVGVSPDPAARHREFIARYGLTFTLLSDVDRSVMRAYGAYGDKLLYGKTVTGVIRSTFVVGPTGLLEHVWYGVRATGHAARVRAALAAPESAS
ncbi:MAG: peroxiredoxin [Acidimicrobiales bacterium]